MSLWGSAEERLPVRVAAGSGKRNRILSASHSLPLPVIFIPMLEYSQEAESTVYFAYRVISCEH